MNSEDTVSITMNRAIENECVEVAPRTIYKRCTFINCDFQGVGHVLFSGCEFRNCTVYGREIDPENPFLVLLVLRAFTLRDCTFI